MLNKVVHSSLVLLVAEALKFILPAYCANAAPVLAGGGFPLDFGKKFIDGKPIFGKNKTFRGFFFGLAVGVGAGFLESVIFGYSAFFGFLLSLGALLGDLTGAFVKRRLGLAPGAFMPVIDQVDFIIGGILLSIPISLPFLTWQIVLTVLVITPPVHLLTNVAAYKLGLKCNPW